MREAAAASLDLSDLGDPKAVGPALQQIVDAENPPLRVFFGKLPGRVVKDHYARKLAEWTDWEHVAHAAHGCPAQSVRLMNRTRDTPPIRRRRPMHGADRFQLHRNGWQEPFPILQPEGDRAGVGLVQRRQVADRREPGQ